MRVHNTPEDAAVAGKRAIESLQNAIAVLKDTVKNVNASCDEVMFVHLNMLKPCTIDSLFLSFCTIFLQIFQHLQCVR